MSIQLGCPKLLVNPLLLILTIAWSQILGSKRIVALGGSPGLVAMGGDSCSKGCEFKSRHRILDGHFFKYLFAVKFVMCF